MRPSVFFSEIEKIIVEMGLVVLGELQSQSLIFLDHGIFQMFKKDALRTDKGSYIYKRYDASKTPASPLP